MRIVIIGAGRAGARLLWLLAEIHSDWDYVIIDHDILLPENIPNHQLRDVQARWLNRYKSEGAAVEAAERYGAEVTYVTEPFGIDFLNRDHPFRPLFIGADMVICVTDEPDVQLEASAVCAALEIPFLTSGVAADGTGEVCLQADLDSCRCYGCFSLPRRRNPPAQRLRGRDLEPGIADHVDEFVVRVARAYLEGRTGEFEDLFGGPPERVVTAWRVPPRGGGPVEKIDYDGAPECRMCSDRARRQRGVPRFPTVAARREMRNHTGVAFASMFGLGLLAAGLLSLLIAHPGTGHSLIPYGLASFLIAAGHALMWPAIALAAALLICDLLIWSGALDRALARVVCRAEIALAVALAAPIELLVIQVAIIIAVVIALGILFMVFCGFLLAAIVSG